MASTHIDEDRVFRAARLLGEVLSAEVDSDEIGLYGTPKFAHVHIFDLLDYWSVAGIGNKNVDWADVISDVPECFFDTGSFRDVSCKCVNLLFGYSDESFYSASDKTLVLEVMMIIFAPD
jgi:hypothetical protein